MQLAGEIRKSFFLGALTMWAGFWWFCGGSLQLACANRISQRYACWCIHWHCIAHLCTNKVVNHCITHIHHVLYSLASNSKLSSHLAADTHDQRLRLQFGVSVGSTDISECAVHMLYKTGQQGLSITHRERKERSYTNVNNLQKGKAPDSTLTWDRTALPSLLDSKWTKMLTVKYPHILIPVTLSKVTQSYCACL